MEDRLAYVAQDPCMRHASMRENLLWANPGASPEAMARALTIVGADTLVARLPQGLDTLVGERGSLVIAIWWVLHRGERLALSDRQVLFERGLLSKPRTEISLASVQAVRITRSLSQRPFNVGNVELFSAGDVAEIAVRAMPDPARIRAIATARSVDLLPQR